MSLRIHGARKRVAGHGTSDKESTQSTNPPLTGGIDEPIGGCCKRGRCGKAVSPLRECVDEGEAVPPQPQAENLEALVARLQETVKTLAGMVEAQSVKINQKAEMITSLANQVVQQAQVGEMNTDKSLHDFLKFDPPIFVGSDQEDPRMFIVDMEMIFKFLGCSSQRSVMFAALQLHDVAATWYGFLEHWRPAGSPPLTWDEFKEAFMARFLPESVRAARACEFERLRQTPKMSVSEYDTRFTELSRYAPKLVPTERDMIRRFVDGLVPSLYKVMVAQTDMFPSYLAAVDTALLIEMGPRKGNASLRKRKRGAKGKPRGASNAIGGPWPQSQTQVLQFSSSTVSKGTEQRSVGKLMGHARNPCTTCGKHHVGQCYKVSGACFQCGQVRHFKKDCPQVQSWFSQGSF